MHTCKEHCARRFHTLCSVQPCVITLQARPSCADHMVLEPKFPCNVTCIITLQARPLWADSSSSTKVFMYCYHMAYARRNAKTSKTEFQTVLFAFCQPCFSPNKRVVYGCLLTMIQTCFGFTLTTKVCPPKKNFSTNMYRVFFRTFCHRCFGLCLASRVVPQEAVLPKANSHQTITFGIVGFVKIPFINPSGHVNASRFSHICIFMHVYV